MPFDIISHSLTTHAAGYNCNIELKIRFVHSEPFSDPASGTEVEALMVNCGSGWWSCCVQRLEEEKLEGRRLGGEART